MNFILEHWLAVGTGIFLAAMILHGHYRGFLRIAVSMSALVISLVIVRLAMPYMTTVLRQNTAIHHIIERGVLKLAGAEGSDESDLNGTDPGMAESGETGLGEIEPGETEQLPAGQRILIEQLNLPEQMKEALVENNNNEVYRMLGVDKFIDYVSAYIANMVLTVIGSILLFIIVYIALRLIMRWLDLIARIPIISGINQIAGAVLGGIQGFLVLWVFYLIVSVCSKTAWASAVMAQINGSSWLSFLYRANIFNWFLKEILNSLV